MSSPFNEEKYKRLLEGLEISEVWLSDIDLGDRIDADFFTKENIQIENKLKEHKAVELRSFASFVASAFYPAATQLYEIGDTPFIRCVDCINYPLITKKQDTSFEKIPKAFVEENNGISLLNKNDIVITKVGSPCFASIIYEHDVVALSRTVMGVKDIHGINPYYLLAFLRSKYGFTQLLRARELTIQYQLTLERVKRVLVYLPDDDFQISIESIIKKSIEKQMLSQMIYSDAENMLLAELGLKGWQPNNNSINIKQLKDSFLASGRMDAEYYLPKYEDYASFIRKHKNGADLLGNICTLNEKNFNPLENSEYKYIELSNIGNSGEITGCTTSIGAELPSRARRLVRTNDVIVSSIEGSLQSVALVTNEYDKAICSTGFYVVKSDMINPETLMVLFKSEPIQNLLKQGCSGTILTAIGRNELQSIVMPKIRNEVQTEIAEYVQKSISLRNEAKQLLESAKLKVEDVISTPPHLIDNQIVIKYNKMVEESTYYYRLAEWTLLQELFAEIWVTTTTANYSIKNYSVCKSSGRWDAEYYQPKYDELLSKLSKNECDTIKHIASIKKSVEPGSEAYQDSGIPFVRVSDVTKFGISEPNVFLSPNDFSLKELQPKKDTILLSKDGSVGIAYKVEEDMDCITSGALLHLSVFNQDYTPDYLTLVLNSIIVQMQADRDSNGAIIQHWKPSEIEQVLIPKLPKAIQDTISAKIQESFALKSESKRLLDEAKMMVEREIESR